MAGSTDTTYGNGGVNMTAQGSPFGFNSNGMDLSGAARFAQQMAMQQMGFRDRQMRLQEDEFGLRKGQVNRGNQLEDTDRERARSEQLRAMMQSRPQADVTPGQFGRFQMNQTGNWGTMVDPANIPVQYQDKIMGGFYGQGGNWDTSNPSITGPQQWQTGKYRGGGGGGAVSGAPGPEQTTNPRAPGAPEDSMASRYFKSFGDIPPWLRNQQQGGG